MSAQIGTGTPPAPPASNPPAPQPDPAKDALKDVVAGMVKELGMEEATFKQDFGGMAVEAQYAAMKAVKTAAAKSKNQPIAPLPKGTGDKTPYQGKVVDGRVKWSVPITELLKTVK